MSRSRGLPAPRSPMSERPGNGTAACGTGELKDRLPWTTSKLNNYKQRGDSGRMNNAGLEEQRFTEDSLKSTISFRRLVAALPRLIVRSRTRFAAALAKSFHVVYNGDQPCSTVFPLPLKDFGTYRAQETSRLSAARWWKICRKRLLHVFIVFLNYLHHDGAAFDFQSLGRRPSHAQMQIHHLGALITVCDLPGEHPLPPGRSGPEFIARLIELSNFVHASPLFDLGGYGGEFHEGINKQGEIKKENYFKPQSEFSPIEPYRSLNASRLKLTGRGDWPMADYLDDILWLPFVEPKILRHGGPVDWLGPDFSRESTEENLKLGLLSLFDSPCDHPARVFNAYKNSDIDRQIGDRRWGNGAELHPTGPSAYLPAGVNLTSIHCPKGKKLIGCVTDRRDFYHQAKVTRARAWSNQLPFAFPVEKFFGFQELQELQQSLARPYHRDTHGDRLGWEKKPSLLTPAPLENVYAGFSSLFQGDHLGVEYALVSHTNLLQEGGLLREESQVLRHRPFPPGACWEIMVIDDYVIVSREASSCTKGTSRAEKKLVLAENIYQQAEVLGSDDKTVRGQDCFKAVGAEITSDNRALSAGVVGVGAHHSKRVSTCFLSLKVANLPVIARGLASRLAGQWISVLMFRRCLTCTIDKLFRLGTASKKQANDVVALDREVAEELVLASIGGLLATTDVSVPYDRQVYATDASLNKGAVTSACVSSSISELLWLGGDRKRAYTLLDQGPASTLRQLGVPTEEEEKVALEGLTSAPKKALDFAFDFVEICGGSGVLSAELVKRGYSVCTPIDLTASEHFDLKEVKLLDWILQMVKERRFRSLGCEPPCTTFSPAQHPASRSYDQPLGFNRRDPKTLVGTTLALRCLTIMLMCFRCSTPAFLEQPRLSKMAWLSAWQWLLSLGMNEAVVASCMLGRIHRKEFRFLLCGFSAEDFEVKCSGGHHHVRVEGAYTKLSAIYAPGVVTHLAAQVEKALTAAQQLVEEKSAGIESVVVNDLLQAARWRTLFSWRWRSPSHINVLESHAYIGLLHRLALRGAPADLLLSLIAELQKEHTQRGDLRQEPWRDHLERRVPLPSLQTCTHLLVLLPPG